MPQSWDNPKKVKLRYVECRFTRLRDAPAHLESTSTCSQPIQDFPIFGFDNTISHFLLPSSNLFASRIASYERRAAYQYWGTVLPTIAQRYRWLPSHPGALDTTSLAGGFGRIYLEDPLAITRRTGIGNRTGQERKGKERNKARLEEEAEDRVVHADGQRYDLIIWFAWTAGFRREIVVEAGVGVGVDINIEH